VLTAWDEGDGGAWTALILPHVHIQRQSLCSERASSFLGLVAKLLVDLLYRLNYRAEIWQLGTRVHYMCSFVEYCTFCLFAVSVALGT